ncbi:piggyBac transposable element-derived protein 4-like [Dermacentor albipictus]|uniref:piggyBac transposable element-derived protein 4-like n=1 Tax=Dermacentor albipictus TaxID=60249 RepID=UPI0031FCC7F2
MARQRSTCVRSLTDEEIQELLMNSDSDDSDSEEAAHLSALSSDESDEEPLPPRNPRKKRKLGERDFCWKKKEFKPQEHAFDPAHSGICNDITAASSELEIFESLFTPDIVEAIVDQTNIFQCQVRAALTPTPGSRIHQWKDVTPREFYLFLAVVMLMAHARKGSIAQYWSTDPLLSTPAFSKLMSRNRFLLILRFLHFSNNEDQIHGDRLHKVRSVFLTLRKNFQGALSPYQDVCIDESLLLFKGRLAFKQYIPSKRSRFGLKSFVLCDVKTGIVLDMVLYTGSSTEINDSEMGYGASVVITLLDKYLGKGHVLWVDNWYTSPALFTYLFEKKTNACGTVRKNRKGIPRDEKRLEEGETSEMCNDQLLFVRWKDKREVLTLTTKHKSGMVESGKVDRKTGENKRIPLCVSKYNICMGAVDKVDMVVTVTGTVTRKCMKWYKKYFFHLLDITILNSNLLQITASGKKRSMADFRLELVRQLIEKYHEGNSKPKGGRPSKGEDPTRLTARHFLSLIPPTTAKQNPTRVCRVCANTQHRPKQRKESRYLCSSCQVPLCVVPCFEEYHTKKVF